MSPAALLALYCVVCVAASLSGGWVPLIVRLTHRRMQVAISFVSGVMLGIGLLHLLPHSFEALGSIDYTMLWVMGGFLFMFFLERFFHFHHHDVGDDALVASAAANEHDDHSPAGHDHAPHRHDHHRGHHHHDHGPLSASFSWLGAIVGLTLHGLIDGVAIAAAVMAEHEGVTWAGLGTFLAIALHKPFDSLTIGTLMAADGRSTAQRHLLNALYSLVTPLGVALCYATSARLGESHAPLGAILGFAAGAFVCIATSDLLPELQFHRHDRTKLSAALVAGIALAWATVYVEGGHDHGHDGEHSADQETEHAHE